MRLFNTLTRTVEQLEPRDEGRVSMYVCGPTVQDVPHFGHARAALVPDVLRRHLEWSGYEVFQVRNITDVEDKIIARAEAEGRAAAAVAEQYSRIYEQQIGRLGVLPPHVAPRATGHIIEMVELIGALEEGGFAYEIDGDVYFSVRRFPSYGQLSGRNLDELRAGARVEADERKNDPADFALWKAAKPGDTFEASLRAPVWPSPWGPGRPGWHIECSAMAGKYLGPGFDIHTGGMDLIFPHHENERAQYEAATGRSFARYWVHNGLLHVGSEKMSKSLGNFITLEEALDHHGANVLRMFYLSSHYRAPVDVDEERLEEAAAAFDRWSAFERATRSLPEPLAIQGEAAAARERFRAALDDDLATPQAHAVLFDLVSAGHQQLAAGRMEDAAQARAVFLELTGVLGYGFAQAEGGAGLVAPLIEDLLKLREQARGRRDFATADGIRARLAALGVVVEDTPKGPRWHLGRAPD
jgi:cysteinyl-tRNA synthetase